MREACTFAISDEIVGELVGVAVGGDDPRTIVLGDLKLSFPEILVAGKGPDRWFTLDGILKSPNGKVDSEKFKKICLEGIGA